MYFPLRYKETQREGEGEIQRERERHGVGERHRGGRQMAQSFANDLFIKKPQFHEDL